MDKLPKGIIITFENSETFPGANTFLIKTPYNPSFLKEFKQEIGLGSISGLPGYEWIDRLKAWRAWTEDFDKVVILARKHYQYLQ